MTPPTRLLSLSVALMLLCVTMSVSAASADRQPRVLAVHPDHGPLVQVDTLPVRLGCPSVACWRELLASALGVGLFGCHC